jgi:hypothetical protein
MKTAFLKKRLDRELESAACEELKDYLLVNSFPGFWTVRALPGDVRSPGSVEEYAQTLAIRENVHMVLVRDGREFVHFHQDGRRSRTLASSHKDRKERIDLEKGVIASRD